MDIPQIIIEVKNNPMGYRVCKLHGPTVGDWEHFFGNVKKANLFLSNNSPHAIMAMLSGMLTVNTGKEKISLFIDSILDTEEYNTIMNILPTINKNAVKLKSMGNT